MLRTSSPAFLGVVVNPKTKAPVYCVRRGYTERTVDIWTVAESSLQRRDRFYIDIATGYLESDSGDLDYRAPSILTGYPRSHTPGAFKDRSKEGGGYGTCLYTGLVLLATAANDDDLEVPNLAGSGPAICSEEETRSPDASRWWYRARALGLVVQETGRVDGDDDEDETEEEVEEDVDLTDYMSRSGTRKVYEAISDEVDNHGEWRVRNVNTIQGDIVRDVPRSFVSKRITADIYKYDAAVKGNLVAVRDVESGTPAAWARITNEALETYKEVILALNIANEDLQMAGKLARLASEAGATEREVTAFMMRNRFGVDSMRQQAAVYIGDEPVARTHRRREPPAEESPQVTNDRILDMMARAGTVRQNPNAPIPIPRRNPTETPSKVERDQLERVAAELDKRRADLGWDSLEVLP